jgi:hypothetical protein
MSGIGLLNEKPLHSSLKAWYSNPGDLFEVPVEGSIIDIVRGRQLIEIQTGGFSSMRSKLAKLLPLHEIRLVHPIPLEKWIIKLPESGEGTATRRKSPKRGRYEDAFREMVSIPELFLDPNLSVDILLTREEETRAYDGRRGWRRRGWVIQERALVEVVERRLFVKAADWGNLLPEGMETFTTADLAEELDLPRVLAQKMAYFLRRTGVIRQIGKRARSILYTRSK